MISTTRSLPPNEAIFVSLREFEQRLAELKDFIHREHEHLAKALEHESAIRFTVTAAAEKALEIKATELFRRLDELNHAHKTAMENWARSLPRELFAQYQSDLDKWKETVNKAIIESAPQNSHIANLDSRLGAIERLSNRLTGAFILLGMMGLAGVLALILGLARIAGVVE